jgi:hypothetical protein
MSEVKDMFRMHFERDCRYVAKRVYNKVLAVDFDSFINAGRHQQPAGGKAIATATVRGVFLPRWECLI